MYLLFNYKEMFRLKTISYTVIMAVIFVLLKKVFEIIFINNPGLSFRINVDYNTGFIPTYPFRAARNSLLILGGLHLFVLYFFISGRWKAFKTKYLYINLTIIPYIIIIFFIHTLFEARNYISAIPFITILFLLFFSTQKNSFLKPIDAIKTENTG